MIIGTLWLIFHLAPIIVAVLIAQDKGRWTLEGLLLGFCLSWIGVIVEAFLPRARPQRRTFR